jgi:hypothetical protein
MYYVPDSGTGSEGDKEEYEEADSLLALRLLVGHRRCLPPQSPRGTSENAGYRSGGCAEGNFYSASLESMSAQVDGEVEPGLLRSRFAVVLLEQPLGFRLLLVEVLLQRLGGGVERLVGLSV